MARVEHRIPAAFAVLLAFALVQPASALTMRQCSAKYKAAQAAGVVGNLNWAQFRDAECGTGASMTIKKVKTPPAAAATGPSMQECSTRYQAAKSAGTLGGMTWNEFRASGCAARTAAKKSKPARNKEAAKAAPATSAKVSEQQCSERYQAAKSARTLGGMTWNAFRSAGCPTTVARRSGSMLPTMGTIFPATIARKYAGEPAGRARELTCRDQYEANKAAGIAESKWTEEGGGYYSECNKRLSQH